MKPELVGCTIGMSLGLLVGLGWMAVIGAVITFGISAFLRWALIYD